MQQQQGRGRCEYGVRSSGMALVLVVLVILTTLVAGSERSSEGSHQGRRQGPLLSRKGRSIIWRPQYRGALMTTIDPKDVGVRIRDPICEAAHEIDMDKEDWVNDLMIILMTCIDM